MRTTMLSLARGSRRTLTTSSIHHTAWSPGPSPPRLPKAEQEIFEQLQKQSTGAFSTPRTPPQINQSPQSSPPQVNQVSQQSTMASSSTAESSDSIQANVKKGDELHPNIRRGAPPEFEGDRNPQTGEHNGPKVEPLRWGGGVDWSYNGRVTDF